MTQNSINNNGSELTIDNLFLDGNTISSTDTNGNIVLAPDGSGTVSVTTAPIVPSGDRADSLGSATNSWDNVYCDGLTFDDGSNIMSAYEESTWTPDLQFGGGTTGITYTSRTGHYIRIGSIVFCGFSFVLSSKGTDTGTATIDGLPFTTASISNGHGGISITWGGITFTGTHTSLGLKPTSSSTTLAVNQSGDSTGLDTISDTSFSNTSQIRGQFFYFV